MTAKHEAPNRLQARASDPQDSAWVNANAGSGKTHVLVNRVVRLLLNGTAPERILCLTYTKAAAAEMSSRLFDELAGWIALTDADLMERIWNHTGHSTFKDTDHAQARRLFTRALETPGGLKVQTIHAFCERLLQRFPVEAGVVPGFEVMDDQHAAELRQMAADRILAAAKANPSSPEAGHLAEMATQASPDTFADLIRQFIDKRRQLAPMVESDAALALTADALHRVLQTSPRDNEADIIAGFTSSLDEAQYGAAAEALGQRSTKTDRERAQTITELLASTSADERFTLLTSLFMTGAGQPRSDISVLTKSAARDHPAIAEFLLAERERFSQTLNRIKALKIHRATMALMVLGAQILATYEEAKRRAGLYDYDDLILKTMDLLGESGASQWVLYKLDGGLDHILIDEAQDTSPEQWRIIEQLSAEFFAGEGARSGIERTIFAVGDRKQSIYSFQGADPSEFDRMREHFGSHAASAGARLAEVPLQVSFRSTAQILDVVDKVFAQPEAAAGLALPGAGVDGHRPTRAGQGGRVELWDLEKPDDKEDRDLWQAPDGEQVNAHPRLKLAARIADTIAQWISAGEELTPRGRPVRYGDILILVRNRTTFADALVRALKLRDIPVAGADRLRLTRHIAVQDLMSLIQFVLLPLDDLSLAEVLKSPLIARDDGKPIDDDDLFAIAHDRGKDSLWNSLKRAAAAGKPYTKALASLENWRRRAGFETPFAFLSRVLTLDKCREKLLVRLGTEANEPLDALLSEALRFEQAHAPDLNGFRAWLEGSDIQIKRDMDHSGNEVRVMTVHGAKGLEANIVILPDTNNVPDRRKIPAILIDEDNQHRPVPFWRLRSQAEVEVTSNLGNAYQARLQEEENRLLYVAMTRARDRLYVCGYADANGEAKGGSWYKLVEDVVKNIGVKTACEHTGHTVWRIKGEQTEAPFERATADEPVHLAQTPPDWARTPRPPEDAGPAWVVASKLAAGAEDETGPPPEQAMSPLAASQTDVFARGNLIHTLLQLLPDVPASERRQAGAQYLALPAHDLADADRNGILAEVMAILEDPDFAAVFAPGSRAEVPLTARIDIGRGPVGLTGQIDRLAVSDDEVLIVDYKTNRPPPARIEDADPAYIRQLAAYRAALSAIYPDRPVRAALLWTNSATFMEIPTDLLEAQVPAGSAVTPTTTDN